MFTCACHVHSKSSHVIGVPSSQTASGLRSTVTIIAVSPLAPESPASPVLLAVLSPLAVSAVVVSDPAVSAVVVSTASSVSTVVASVASVSSSSSPPQAAAIEGETGRERHESLAAPHAHVMVLLMG